MKTQCAKCKNVVDLARVRVAGRRGYECPSCGQYTSGAGRYSVRRPGNTSWCEASTLGAARRERQRADDTIGGHVIVDNASNQIVD